MKKTLVVLLSVLMALMASWAVAAEIDMNEIGGYIYDEQEDGTIALWLYYLHDSSILTIEYLEENDFYIDIPETIDGYTVTAIVEGMLNPLNLIISPERITLPNSLRYIDETAIGGDFTTLTIPASVTEIEPGAFGNCPMLEEIIVEEGNPVYMAIDGVLFTRDGQQLVCYPAGKSGHTYEIPEGTTAIWTEAFASRTYPAEKNPIAEPLERIVIPDSVTEIGMFAFSGRENLTSIHIGSGVTVLPFLGNREKLSKLHETLIYVGNVVPLVCSENPFILMPELTTLTVSEDNPVYYVKDGMLLRREVLSLRDEFGLDGQPLTQLVYCPAWKTGDVTVPEEVNVIGWDAFAGCEIGKLRLSDNVMAICGEAFCYGCTIDELYIPDSVTMLGDVAGQRIRLPLDLQMNVTITGEAEPNYIFPDAITAERLDAFLEVLTTKNKRTIQNYYKKIDPAKYSKKDNAEELEATYPALKDGTVIYVMILAREDMRQNEKEKLESAFAEAGYTEADLLEDRQLVGSAEVEAEEEPGFVLPWKLQCTDLAFPMGARVQNLPSGLAVGWVVQCGAIPDDPCSGDFMYVLNADGTACITAYTGYDSDVVIPAEVDGHAVTGIAGEAFLFAKDLRTVQLPDSVTEVAETAFLYCEQLTEIHVSPDHPTLASIDGVLFEKASRTLLCYPEGRTQERYEIPNGIRRIAPYAFTDIGILRPEMALFGDVNEDGLRELILPASVTEISPRAFYSNSSLTRVTIGTGVTTIGDYAFYNCDALTEITIPGNVVSIGDSAFYDCAALRNVVLEDGVTSIGTGAFAGCTSLETVHIPASVTEMGAGVFGSCIMLTSVTIAPGVTAIPQNAFYNCKALTSIDIPASVTDIGDGAFQQCNALETATISGCEARIGDKAFENCSALKNVAISEGVLHIGSEAFRNCRALKSVTFPETMTTIGEFAFYGCESLINVALPPSMREIGKAAFYGCHALESATLSPGLTEIPESMFSDCYLLREVEIPEGVTSIASGAFWNCGSLTELSLPASIEYIGEGAFDYCPFAEVTVPRNSYAAQWCKENNLRYTYPDSLDWLLD